MPELPEVETVRRGLAPALCGRRILTVDQRRPDLRYPFPERFVERLTGASVLALVRRGKYLLIDLDTRETLIVHLGMSGRFTVTDGTTPGAFHHQIQADAHVHVVFTLSGGASVQYADPRRFGFMDLVPTPGLAACRHFAAMGPEPTEAEFSADVLRSSIGQRRAPIKAILLDQSVVAGLGNIYVCEALFRSRISPRRAGASLGGVRARRLVDAIKAVLSEAIAAGGSSLRDYVAADGTMGRFQMTFDVYDRAQAPCHHCGSSIQRIVQSGRSTFFCATCQR